MSVAFADIQKYNYNINDSVTTFLVINYHQIVNDTNHNGGEYISSLFNQLSIENKQEKINQMKEIMKSDMMQFDKIRKIKQEILLLK